MPTSPSPIVECAACGATQPLSYGALAVRDSDAPATWIGRCCAESFLRALLTSTEEATIAELLTLTRQEIGQ